MDYSNNPEYYSLRPKVVQDGVATDITIRTVCGNNTFREEKYLVEFRPMQSVNIHTFMGEEPFDCIEVKPENGVLKFTYTFKGEQEYSIVIYRFDENNELEKLVVLRAFCLYEDLYKLRPFKGDTHVHSENSDGKESVTIVGANYRKYGFDFMAITDHKKLPPSKQLIDAFKDLPTGLTTFYGEEVHVPTGYIHVVNFGGKISVNDAYFENPEQFEKDIALLEKDIPDDCPDKHDFAIRLWIANKIHEGGGIAIFVHPHWIVKNVYNVADDNIRYILKSGAYDAFELLNGADIYENNMQTLMYSEMREEGITVPVLGGSDSHGTQVPPRWFNILYSIVFAENTELETLRDAIKNLRSVAVEKYDDKYPRVYGKYRYAKYAIFLLREYFPLYEKLCFEQGESLKAYFYGTEKEKELALQTLNLIKDRTDNFYKDFFGRK